MGWRVGWVSWLVCGAAAMVWGLPCPAQDRRQVTEPKVPAVCSTVRARLSSLEGRVRAEDERRLDSARLQAALDGCARGEAVELAAEGTGDGRRDAFLTGPISIPSGVTLLVDGGVTLFGSRDPAVYAVVPGSCGVVNDEAPGCRPMISVHRAPHAAVMGGGVGEAVIDGRGYAQLLPVAGQDAGLGAGVSSGQGAVTWWQLAEQARAGGRQQVPRMVVVDGSDDFTLYRITLRNSPNFHVTYANGTGFTVWGVRIETPRNARNTDGIDPGGSATDITVAHSFISTGDDHIAIKGSGSGVRYVSVLDNHFYFGHGMSIGSETFGGVSDVLVRSLTLDGADNGIRIKSNVHRGGLVERVTYDDVCIRDNRYPVTLDTRYDNPGPNSNLLPRFRQVEVRHVRISGGGQVVVDGVDAQHRTEVRFDDVQLDDPAAYRFFAKDAVVGYGPGLVNFRLQGEDVAAKEFGDGKGAVAAMDCAGRFVPFTR